ncbi:MAG: hypothetical protein COA79_02140 [Planctomycetota bacterium]|nr:MAG: hypothetical protein COA79_02140 [Planctomycetota bacterium]
MKTKFLILKQIVLFITLSLIISSCGNNSEDGTSGKKAKITADAGPNVTIKLGESAFLNGAASTPQAEISRYFWLKTTGPDLVFIQDSPNQFLTPTEVGTYTFRLFVFSADGASDTDDVTITVGGQKPLSIAGDDQAVVVNKPVQLDGSASVLRSEGILRYLWTPVTFPSGDKPLLLQTSPTPIFTPLTLGTYEFSLIVSTEEFTSTPDFVSIAVTNILPVANAGVDKSVFINTLAQLDGTKSIEPDDSVPIYTWTQLQGPTINLLNSGTLKPSFFPDVKGTYQFGLTLKVNGISSTQDTVDIVVIDETGGNVPIADPGKDVTGFVGEIVELDGTASTSPTGGELIFTWFQTGGEPNDIDASNLNSSKITLIAKQPGVYTYSLVVFDGQFTSAAQTVLVNMFRREDTNLGPVIFEPIDRITARIGEPIMLDISAIDLEDNPINYITTTQVPQGENYRLDAALDPIIVFRPNLAINSKSSFTFTMASQDGISQTVRRVQVDLIPHQFGRNDSRTAIIGNVTDVQGTPLINVAINCGISVTKTDKNGRFSLIRIPDGKDITLILDGRRAFTQAESDDPTRAFVYELETTTVDLEPFINNTISREFTLYRVFSGDLVDIRRDKESVVKAISDAVVEDFELKVPASSPMGITGAFTSSMSVHSIDLSLTPGQWDTLFTPAILTKVRPHHVKYRIPASIKIPNTANLPGGTIATLWKLDTAKNILIPLNDITVKGNTLETEKGGLTENGYLFTALSVSGIIRSGKEKVSINEDNLKELEDLRKYSIEIKKEIASVINQEKMSDSLGAISLLSSFNAAYDLGFLQNESLGNSAYKRLQIKFVLGSELAKVIEAGSTIADEIDVKIDPIVTKLNDFLKNIKRDAVLTSQINELKDLFITKGFDLENNSETLLIKDILAKRKAQIKLITDPLQDVVFTNESLTEVAAAKIAEPVSVSNELYTNPHPYTNVLVRLDEFVADIEAIFDTHIVPNEKDIMTVLEVLNATDEVQEVIAMAAIDRDTYIGNLDNRIDLLGQRIRLSSYARSSNRIGTSRTIVLGQESATDLDVFINEEAQLVAYELPDESLAIFPSSLEITDNNDAVIFSELKVNTFIRVPLGQYSTKVVSKSEKTTSIPFAVIQDQTHFIRFGQITLNGNVSIKYKEETLELFNKERNLTYSDLTVNDTVILPSGTYLVKSKSTNANQHWSGTITLLPGDDKSPFGTMQYANFSVDETYAIPYEIINLNGNTAYTSLDISEGVLLLPGNYNVKSVQENENILPHTKPFTVLLDDVVNPFGIVIIDVFTALSVTYADRQLELLRNDQLMVSNLTPGSDLVLLPGRYNMRVVGQAEKMTYDIVIEEGQRSVVMGIVKFTETNKLYNIKLDDKIIYENVGNETSVILAPGLYTLDAVDDDGIDPQDFNIVFNSVFIYPDDVTLKKSKSKKVKPKK